MKGTGNPQIIIYTGDGKGKTIRRSKLETKLVRLKQRSFYDVVNAKFKK